MPYFVYMFLCICSVLLSVSSDVRIGVIGGGIGGRSCAYWLRKEFGSEAVIEVFQSPQSSAFGRVVELNLNGNTYEAGATIVHPDNKYMRSFADEFDLGIRKVGSEGILEIFDGERHVFESSQYGIVTAAKFFWHFGWDMVRLKSLLKDLLDNFSNIYKHQHSGMAFQNPLDLLYSMDPKFVNMTQITLRDWLVSQGMSDQFIDELARGALKTNYGQDVDVHSFVGMVSLAGATPGLWALEKGNKQIPELLFKHSEAVLINEHVSSLSLLSDGSYWITSSAADDLEANENDHFYDIVIIAFPLHNRFLSALKLNNITLPFSGNDIKFHRTVATFVRAPGLNKTYLDYASSPAQVLTCSAEKGLFFNSIGLQRKLGISINEAEIGDSVNKNVYKVFSSDKLKEEELSLLFSNDFKVLHILDFLAYPEYSSKDRFLSFKLHHRLYYANAIEQAASAMEMAIVGSRNVALLSFNEWNSYYDRIDQFVSNENDQETKQEL